MPGEPYDEEGTLYEMDGLEAALYDELYELEGALYEEEGALYDELVPPTPPEVGGKYELEGELYELEGELYEVDGTLYVFVGTPYDVEGGLMAGVPYELLGGLYEEDCDELYDVETPVYVLEEDGGLYEEPNEEGELGGKYWLVGGLYELEGAP